MKNESPKAYRAQHVHAVVEANGVDRIAHHRLHHPGILGLQGLGNHRLAVPRMLLQQGDDQIELFAATELERFQGLHGGKQLGADQRRAAAVMAVDELLRGIGDCRIHGSA